MSAAISPTRTAVPAVGPRTLPTFHLVDEPQGSAMPRRGRIPMLLSDRASSAVLTLPAHPQTPLWSNPSTRNSPTFSGVGRPLLISFSVETAPPKTTIPIRPCKVFASFACRPATATRVALPKAKLLYWKKIFPSSGYMALTFSPTLLSSPSVASTFSLKPLVPGVRRAASGKSPIPGVTIWASTSWASAARHTF
uniref:Uncharacterized protein n=1 Tax=uncultured marine virus TaxID=186617 RepID=A0A0F7L7T2_9VIRU|nr:hypothetical protein [uncultured marine virus]